MAKRTKTARKRANTKFQRVMNEFRGHKLHSGSKKGKLVTNSKQALAIAYSEQRRRRRRAAK
jgi:hypothetical protein